MATRKLNIVIILNVIWTNEQMVWNWVVAVVAMHQLNDDVSLDGRCQRRRPVADIVTI